MKPLREHAMTLRLSRLLSLCLLAWSCHASAYNKCVVDGHVTYQDLPCPAELGTVGQELQRRQHYVELEKKLDRLAANGYGMAQRAPKSTDASVPIPDDEPAPPRARSRAEFLAQRDARFKRVEQVLREREAARLEQANRDFEKAKEACGGEMQKEPTIGMRDDTFRECTLQARFGGIRQVVALEDGGVPLRLYIFDGGNARRVYSIGGVVTNIKH